MKLKGIKVPNPLVKVQESWNSYRHKHEVGSRTKLLATDWGAQGSQGQWCQVARAARLTLLTPSVTLWHLLSLRASLSADGLRENIQLVSNS